MITRSLGTFYIKNIKNSKSPFINKGLLDKNTLKKDIYTNKKIIIKRTDIRLMFLYSKEEAGFCLYYSIVLNPKFQSNKDMIDMVSLKKALEDNLPASDKKYIKVSDFDVEKVKFELDKKWIKDAISGISGRTQALKLNRTFDLKTKIPRVIMTDINSRNIFKDYILKNFKVSLKQDFDKKYFKYLIPMTLFKNKLNYLDFFDWDYDLRYNRVVVKMKTMYLIALLFATSTATKELRKHELSGTKEKSFSDKVIGNMKNFDLDKWKKFTRKRKLL